MASDTPGGASAPASDLERASSLPPRRGGLGRGLEALIPTLGDEAASSLEIDIDAIAPNPYQPRIELDQDANTRKGPRISRPESRVSVWVVPTNEELMIARHTGLLLGLIQTHA